MCYSDGSGIQANADAKAFVWSGKFTPKIRSESGKLSSVGCHFTPKLTNFGTLHHTPNTDISDLRPIILLPAPLHTSPKHHQCCLGWHVLTTRDNTARGGVVYFLYPQLERRPRARSNLRPLLRTNGLVWLWGMPGAVPKCLLASRAVRRP